MLIPPAPSLFGEHPLLAEELVLAWERAARGLLSPQASGAWQPRKPATWLLPQCVPRASAFPFLSLSFPICPAGLLITLQPPMWAFRRIK